MSAVAVRVRRHAIVKPPDTGAVTVRVRRHAIVKPPDTRAVTVRVRRHAIVKAPDTRSVAHCRPVGIGCLTRMRVSVEVGRHAHQRSGELE
jgi:hypothetical protein